MSHDAFMDGLIDEAGRSDYAACSPLREIQRLGPWQPLFGYDITAIVFPNHRHCYQDTSLLGAGGLGGNVLEW